MTQDEIIEMAEQAGVAFSSDDYPDIWGVHMHVGKQELVAFANLVAAKATEEANAIANASWTLMCKKMVAFEREACAKVVDDIEARCIAKDVDDPPLKHVAAAIRARGEQA
jgi:regulator of sigma D